MEVSRMDDFFDGVSKTYDAHMKDTVRSFERFYERIAEAISPSDGEVKILDLGIGTGLELPSIFRKAPHALIDGIDLSEKMLDELAVKFRDRLDRIRLYRESYLTFSAPENHYDYVVSSMTVHHFTPEVKSGLYRDIYRFLKPSGIYIEADYYVTPFKERKLLERYRKITESIHDYREGSYHIDIPFSARTQKRLFKQAGFTEIRLIHREKENGIFTASK